VDLDVKSTIGRGVKRRDTGYTKRTESQGEHSNSLTRSAHIPGIHGVVLVELHLKLILFGQTIAIRMGTPVVLIPTPKIPAMIIHI
jgi:hypothetical protein